MTTEQIEKIMVDVDEVRRWEVSRWTREKLDSLYQRLHILRWEQEMSNYAKSPHDKS